MWTALTLVVLAAAPGPDPATVEVAAGTLIRLAAGPAVDVPGLFSGTDDTHTARRTFERRNGLLVFARPDGSTEAVIAPGATVSGALVGAEPGLLHLRRSDDAPPERIHRASVARAWALWGSTRRTGKGALFGGVTGATVGFGFSQLFQQRDELPVVDQYTLGYAAIVGALGAAVGGVIGSFVKEDDWTEIPLEALPGRTEAAAPGPEPRDLVRAVTTRASGMTWKVVPVDGGRGLTLALVPVTAEPPTARASEDGKGATPGSGSPRAD